MPLNARYDLTIYADGDDLIFPERVKELIEHAETLAGVHCPIEYVPPAQPGTADTGPMGRWGLRITITDGDD